MVLLLLPLLLLVPLLSQGLQASCNGLCSAR